MNTSTNVAYNLMLKELESETKAEANYISFQFLYLNMPIDGLSHAIRTIAIVNTDYNLIETDTR